MNTLKSDISMGGEKKKKKKNSIANYVSLAPAASQKHIKQRIHLLQSRESHKEKKKKKKKKRKNNLSRALYEKRTKDRPAILSGYEDIHTN